MFKLQNTFKNQFVQSRKLKNLYQFSLSNIKDPSFIEYDESLFSKEQQEYILQLQNMKYTDLLAELKKYELKPENR